MKSNRLLFLFSFLLVISIASFGSTAKQTENSQECPLCASIAPSLKELIKTGNCLGSPDIDPQACENVLRFIAPHILMTTNFLARNDEIGARARALLGASSTADNEELKKYMEKGAKAYNAALSKTVNDIPDGNLTDEKLPELFGILEKQSCKGVDKETCQKAEILLLRCSGVLWFTLSGEAGKATRSLLIDSPEQDAHVLQLMQKLCDKSNEIREKMNIKE